jgi:hypothetical protein
VALDPTRATTASEIAGLAAALVQALDTSVRLADSTKQSFLLAAASSNDAQAWDAACSAFNAALSAEQEYCWTHLQKKTPFELEYHSVRTTQDAEEGKVTLEGGDITDKDGRSIWESRCYVTGRVMQSGSGASRGESALRYTTAFASAFASE